VVFGDCPAGLSALPEQRTSLCCPWFQTLLNTLSVWEVLEYSLSRQDDLGK
jgi:hypothetical protein